MKSWLDESQAEIKTAGRNISNLRYADDTTVMSESEEEVNQFFFLTQCSYIFIYAPLLLKFVMVAF